jgi:hypothetical protein
MAFSYTKLMDIMELPASTIVAASAASAVYINPINTATYVAEIEIHNTTSLSASVVLYCVPDNASSLGVPAASSEIVKYTMAAFDTVWIEPKYPYVLEDDNEAIFGVASTSGINIMVRGGKET